MLTTLDAHRSYVIGLRQSPAEITPSRFPLPLLESTLTPLERRGKVEAVCERGG